MRLLAFCLLAIALVSALSACNEENASTPAPASMTASSAPGASSAGAVETPHPTPPPGLTPARVVSVVDGDTIHVEIDGVDLPLRYIGVDAPEVPNRGEPAECFGPEASDFNEFLVLGRTVFLEKDTRETDDFGRLLRHAYLDDQLVSVILVREGCALAKSYPPDTRYDALFAAAEREAEALGAGMWGATCDLATQAPAASTATAPSTTGRDDVCDFSGTNEAVIKGNISQSSGEWIYHVPGQADYENTRISESAGEHWFCTESDAVSAGWRRALR